MNMLDTWYGTVIVIAMVLGMGVLLFGVLGSILLLGEGYGIAQQPRVRRHVARPVYDPSVDMWESEKDSWDTEDYNSLADKEDTR